MSYQVLARKWRPTSFDTVVGQSYVLTALANGLNHDRLHHAYLFSGTRGVGKTTIARLFAKGLNCEQGVSSTPCGHCQTCREIDEGRFPDLIEIDAASRTKVEDTRDILDNVQYKPARGRYKVYIIDEVHMLSKHSFNALLKTLEEPPEYVKFILATTDPQKLPVTVLSRCLQFHLKHLEIDEIKDQLKRILSSEKIESDPRALSLIAHAAEGSMRDALSLTDQAIALGNGVVSVGIVTQMLGTLDISQALHLLSTIAQGDVASTMEQLHEVAAMGVQWDALLKDLANLLYKLAIMQALPDTNFPDMSQADRKELSLLVSLFSAEEIQLCYQIAIKSREDLPLAPEGKVGIEMALLRMLAFRPAVKMALQPQPVISKAKAIAPQQTLANDRKLTLESEKAPKSATVPKQHTSNQHQVKLPKTPPQMKPIQDPSSLSDVTAKSEAKSVTLSEQQPMSHQSAAQALISARNRLRSQILAEKKEKKSDPDAQTPSVVHRPKQNRAETQHPEKKRLNRDSSESPFASLPSASDLSVPSHDTDVADVMEDYQWQATEQYAQMVHNDISTQVAPSEIKKDLQHDKTLEMTQKLVQEVMDKDSWAKIISQLHLPKLVEQLVLNSSYKATENTDGSVNIHLNLRPNQSHICNEKNQHLLSQALSNVLNKVVNLQIEVGNEGVTPMEEREALYQEKLNKAIEILSQDPNIERIRETFDAKVIDNSIRPI